MTEDVEEWRPVPGWPYYEVSDHGRVRSIDRVVVSRTGVSKKLRGKVLTPRRKSCGHLIVGLSRADGERLPNKFVHHLVLEAFVGPRPADTECLHKNDIGSDNRLSNLRWGTRAENQQDRVRHGTHHETRKITCPYGHLLRDPNNVPSAAKIGSRRCRACARAVSLGHYHLNRGHVFDVRAEADRQYARLMNAVEVAA